MVMDKTAPVLILGAGAWGLSSALRLAEAGYSNITVFDRAEAAPSPYSAANDLNKIIRAEYEDPFYTALTLVHEYPASKLKVHNTKVNFFVGCYRGLENASLWPLLPPNRLHKFGVGCSSAESCRYVDEELAIGLETAPIRERDTSATTEE